MSRLLSIFIFLLCTANAQTPNYGIKEGDLVFQNLDCGPICEAIEAVTPAYKGQHFSHIGLVVNRHDSLFVIEAIGKDVHLTPLNQFLERDAKWQMPHRTAVGRLKAKYAYMVPAVVEAATKTLGTPYDDDFLYNNGKYYCSEMLYDAFKVANDDKAFFPLFPMTFKQPNTNDFYPVWVNYYKDLGKPIPEGKPGLNPGGMSIDKKIKVHFLFQ